MGDAKISRPDAVEKVLKSCLIRLLAGRDHRFEARTGCRCTVGSGPVLIDPIERSMGGFTDLGVLVHEGNHEVFDPARVAVKADCSGGGFADVHDGITEERQQERSNLPVRHSGKVTDGREPHIGTGIFKRTQKVSR